MRTDLVCLLVPRQQHLEGGPWGVWGWGQNDPGVLTASVFRERWLILQGPLDFPGGAVDRNLPANAGVTGFIPGLILWPQATKVGGPRVGSNEGSQKIRCPLGRALNTVESQRVCRGKAPVHLRKTRGFHTQLDEGPESFSFWHARKLLSLCCLKWKLN